jgi:hypothetical protein
VEATAATAGGMNVPGRIRHDPSALNEQADRVAVAAIPG